MSNRLRNGILCLCLAIGMLVSCSNVKNNKASKLLEVGYSTSIDSLFDKAHLERAKSVGIGYFETSINAYIKSDRTFKISEEKIADRLTTAKQNVDSAGLDIWSIHMPANKTIDLSLKDEGARNEVVALHKKVLSLVKILDPEIILFHPSYYLGLNEREVRTEQLVKSVDELNDFVQGIGAQMVIENMLGYTLMKDENRERPLMRTVKETNRIMDQMPETVYSAIDMNHIYDPERLILAMGDRLKSLHVADGDGKHEYHYLPCSGKGENDWVSILYALEKVEYSGPFLFEVKSGYYNDPKELTDCYQSLYNNFISEVYSEN